jgi:hypothetical protein
MSKRLLGVAVFTPTALADAADITTGLGMHISAGGATNRCSVSEIYMGGQATSSNVQIMQFARNGTISGTKTALVAPNSDGPMDGLTQAVTTPSLGFIAATVTQPQRSNSTSAARLNLTFNAFGGIVRWVAPPGGEWFITGITANVSESSLSAYTGSGGGAMGAHIVYEQV